MLRCAFVKDCVLLNSLPRGVVADDYMPGFVTLYTYMDCGG